MTSESLRSRFEFFWGLSVVAAGCWTAWPLYLLFFACCSSFPNVPTWLWTTYAATQLANRIPIGWKWLNGWAPNVERLLFLCAMSSFLVAMTARTEFDLRFWMASSFISCAWAMFYLILAMNDGKEHPLKNRIFGVFMGSFIQSPLWIACLSALKHSG